MKKLVQIKRHDNNEVIHEIETEEINVSKHVIMCLEDGINKGINFSHADLYGANLLHADLSHADLSHADLSHAVLSHSNFSDASLSRADFYGTDFYGTDFYGADFYGADFYGADFYGAKDKHITIGKALFFNNIYKYQCAAILDINNLSYIKLGCHFKLETEWEDDGFWNNTNEFPNDDENIDTQRRKIALKLCKDQIALMRKELK